MLGLELIPPLVSVFHSAAEHLDESHQHTASGVGKAPILAVADIECPPCLGQDAIGFVRGEDGLQLLLLKNNVNAAHPLLLVLGLADTCVLGALIVISLLRGLLGEILPVGQRI